jgi:hydroxyethylthiazole kinase-like uncharacterized protein yjeF
MPVRVVSGQEAAALDAEAIANGVPSRALMRVAASNAASIIASRCHDRLANGVTIYTGPGNNGGDGWCLARAFVQLGIPVCVHEVLPARSPDAVAERELIYRDVERIPLDAPTDSRVIIDAILGTGGRGGIEGPIYDAVLQINLQRGQGAFVAAIDLPTGIDATSGAGDFNVYADLTVALGACKRGHLLAREYCGEIVVVDIGLSPTGHQNLPQLISASDVYAFTPEIPFDAHKGDRGRLTIVAGNEGMGGAAILAAEAALRSGIGLVKVCTHPSNISAVHARLPEVLVEPFPNPRSDIEIDQLADWPDSLLIGPGLGNETETRQLVEAILPAWRGATVIDADALNVFAGDVSGLARLTQQLQSCVITPHPAEFARLIASDTYSVTSERFDIGISLAQELNAVVLLKGTPTVITLPDGTRYVMANGTAALATGGSGDMLSGMIGALLAQEGLPHTAAVAAAWVHARAAELCGANPRGVTLRDIFAQLHSAWTVDRGATVPMYPVLAQLPKVA